MKRYRVTTQCLAPNGSWVTSRFETDSLERAIDAAWGELSVLTEVRDGE